MEFPSDSCVDLLPPGWSCFSARHEDRPFDSRLTLFEERESSFGLTPCIKAKGRDARLCVLANLVCLREDQWSFYSRDNNHYAGLGRYAPGCCRRRWICGAVDELTMAGLIEDERTRPSPSARYRSRMQPTARFWSLASTIPARDVVFAPAEVIILRNVDGDHVHYADTRLTKGMRVDVMEQNEFLAGVDIGIDHPQIVDAQGFLLVNGCRVPPRKTSLHRVFNCTFGKGGRWYGGWWQNLPSSARQAILIDGEATIEEDIACCHPHFLLAAQGQELGSDDFYGRVKRPRGNVKLAVNVMLNAPSRRKAFGALRKKLEPIYGLTAGKQAADLIQAVEDTFPELSTFWNKGVGLVLQNIDAQLCSWILHRLRYANIACLSIHDSFIAKGVDHAALRNVMQEGLERAHNSLREKGLSNKSIKIF